MLGRIEDGVRRAHALGGAAAPVRRRRVARAAHAGDHHPRLRRAVPDRRARRRARPRRARCGAPSRRRCAWACSSTTCCTWPGSTRGARSSGTPVDLGALVDDAVRDARAVDPDRPITTSRLDGPRPCPATTTGSARSSPTSSGTRSCTPRRAPPVDVRLVRDGGRARARGRRPRAGDERRGRRAARSSASTAPIRRARATEAGAGSGWPSWRRRSPRTAGSVSLDSEPGPRHDRPRRASRTSPARDDGARGNGGRRRRWGTGVRWS